MTQLATFDDLFKHAFGFDRVFNELDRVHRQYARDAGFPPYNITVNSPKDPSKYVVELAVAGYSREELEVTIVMDRGVRTLMVTGKKQESPEQDEPTYVVKMLAARYFNRQFTLAEEAEVESVELKDGILRITVSVNREALKPAVKLLTIN
jgi:molecular chaperone IbpA